MKTQQRTFVVEIKSARRRLKTQPKSIWGNTDFGALIRDNEAALPFMQNAIPESSATRRDLQLEAKQQIEVADPSGGGEEQPAVMTLSESDEIDRRQHEEVFTESEVSKVALGGPQHQTVRTAKDHRKSRASSAAARKMPPVMSANNVVEVQYDELASLNAENVRLRQLFAEYLRQQNARLRKMLKRFE
jgi:hypothetical protein